MDVKWALDEELLQRGPWLSPDIIARGLDLSERTFFRMVRERKIPPSQSGRYCLPLVIRALYQEQVEQFFAKKKFDPIEEIILLKLNQAVRRLPWAVVTRLAEESNPQTLLKVLDAELRKAMGDVLYGPGQDEPEEER